MTPRRTGEELSVDNRRTGRPTDTVLLRLPSEADTAVPVRRSGVTETVLPRPHGGTTGTALLLRLEGNTVAITGMTPVRSLQRTGGSPSREDDEHLRKQEMIGVGNGPETTMGIAPSSDTMIGFPTEAGEEECSRTEKRCTGPETTGRHRPGDRGQKSFGSEEGTSRSCMYGPFCCCNFMTCA